MSPGCDSQHSPRGMWTLVGKLHRQPSGQLTLSSYLLEYELLMTLQFTIDENFEELEKIGLLCTA